MKRIVLLLITILSLTTTAQNTTDSLTESQEQPPKKLSFLRRVIRGFDRLDTAYIEPQHYAFTVMLQATHTYDIYTLSSSGENKQTVTFAPDNGVKLGPYFGWKWVFAGYTFRLDNVTFSDNRQGLDLSIYSSQIGLDLFYRWTGRDYKLRDADFGKDYNVNILNAVPFDGITAGITGFNAYYIFNHGRFSYPATFAQSTVQKVSCGSWMAGFGYMKNTIELDHSRLQELVNEKLGARSVKLDSGLMFNRIKYYDFSLSVGYAYNWVFARHWLLGGCVQAALAHKRSVGDVENGSGQGFSFGNINIDGIGRFGLVYNYNTKWFAGASVILHTYNYHKSRFSTKNTFGSMNVYVGYNFGLMKKYKQK